MCERTYFVRPLLNTIHHVDLVFAPAKEPPPTYVTSPSCCSFTNGYLSPQVFHDELSSTRLWVSMHVSDHSGFHYRQYLLKELIAELSQAAASTTTTTTSTGVLQHMCSTVAGISPPHHDQANGEEAGEDGRQLSSTALLQLFHQEVELCTDLIQSFPGHETLWSHR